MSVKKIAIPVPKVIVIGEHEVPVGERIVFELAEDQRVISPRIASRILASIHEDVVRSLWDQYDDSVKVRQAFPDFSDGMRSPAFRLWARADTLEAAWPTDFEWAWVVQHGKWRGKLAARISQVIYENFHVKLSERMLSKIGTVLSADTFPPGTYYFDFKAPPFDWASGDFADGGSCFWGGRTDARALMAMYGCVALRFFKDRDFKKGIGRAWIIPHSYEKSIVLFNAYHAGLGNRGDTFARIVQGWSGAKTAAAIYMNNKAGNSDMLYINGNHAYLIGNPPPKIVEEVGGDLHKAQHTLSLKWMPVYECEFCHESTRRDERGQVRDHDSILRLYCDRCCSNEAEICKICGGRVPRGQLLYRARHSQSGELVRVGLCRYCERNCIQCSECGALVLMGQDRQDSYMMLRCDAGGEQRVVCKFCISKRGGSRACRACSFGFLPRTSPGAGAGPLALSGLVSRDGPNVSSDNLVGRWVNIAMAAPDFRDEFTLDKGMTIEQRPFSRDRWDIPGMDYCPSCSVRFAEWFGAIGDFLKVVARLPGPTPKMAASNILSLNLSDTDNMEATLYSSIDAGRIPGAAATQAPRPYRYQEELVRRTNPTRWYDETDGMVHIRGYSVVDIANMNLDPSVSFVFEMREGDGSIAFLVWDADAGSWTFRKQGRDNRIVPASQVSAPRFLLGRSLLPLNHVIGTPPVHVDFSAPSATEKSDEKASSVLEVKLRVSDVAFNTIPESWADKGLAAVPLLGYWTQWCQPAYAAIDFQPYFDAARDKLAAGAICPELAPRDALDKKHVAQIDALYRPALVQSGGTAAPTVPASKPGKSGSTLLVPNRYSQARLARQLMRVRDEEEEE